MRGIETVIKPAEEGGGGFEHLVVKHAKNLLGENVFGDPVVVIETGLGAPADVQRGMHMGFGPVHDLAQLRPVIHGFKVHVFHRRAGDHQPVIEFVLNLVKRGVKGLQVAPIYILGTVADGLQQFHLDLKGCVGKFPQQLGFCGNFGGHQVQDQQLEGTDILVDGPVLRHDKNILALQSGAGGQRVGNFDGHGEPPSWYAVGKLGFLFLLKIP